MADAEGLLLLRAGGAAADGHGRVQHSTADINDNGKRQREDPSDEYEKVRQLQPPSASGGSAAAAPSGQHMINGNGVEVIVVSDDDEDQQDDAAAAQQEQQLLQAIVNGGPGPSSSNNLPPAAEAAMARQQLAALKRQLKSTQHDLIMATRDAARWRQEADYQLACSTISNISKDHLDRLQAQQAAQQWGGEHPQQQAAQQAAAARAAAPMPAATAAMGRPASQRRRELEAALAATATAVAKQRAREAALAAQQVAASQEQRLAEMRTAADAAQRDVERLEAQVESLTAAKRQSALEAAASIRALQEELRQQEAAVASGRERRAAAEAASGALTAQVAALQEELRQQEEALGAATANAAAAAEAAALDLLAARQQLQDVRAAAAAVDVQVRNERSRVAELNGQVQAAAGLRAAEHQLTQQRDAAAQEEVAGLRAAQEQLTQQLQSAQQQLTQQQEAAQMEAAGLRAAQQELQGHLETAERLASTATENWRVVKNQMKAEQARAAELQARAAELQAQLAGVIERAKAEAETANVQRQALEAACDERAAVESLRGQLMAAGLVPAPVPPDTVQRVLDGAAGATAPNSAGGGSGLQVLLIVFSGWAFSRFDLLEPDKFGPQMNVLLLRVGFTSLNMYQLAGILVYTRFFNGRNLRDAALLNLVLTSNNTVIIGLPVLAATFPEAGGPLALLSALPLFVQAIPFSIVMFEVGALLAERAAAVDARLPSTTRTKC
eukprot:XP_001692707.1 predicted protein [Chlamydomonas reinhardtii]